MTVAPILILDASLLINFLKVDRIDIVRVYPAEILITEHVRDEVTTAYPAQLARLDKAIKAGILEVMIIDDIADIEQIVAFREDRTQRQLGIGECSAIIMALRRNLGIGIDDGPAIQTIRREFPHIHIIRTVDLIIEAIKEGFLSIVEADQIKDEWERSHRFKLKFRSFNELIKV